MTLHRAWVSSDTGSGIEGRLVTLLDVTVVTRLFDHSAQPMRPFGENTMQSFVIGILTFFAALALTAVQGIAAIANPVLSASAVAVLFGFQISWLGIIGAIRSWRHFGRSDRCASAAHRCVNFDS